MIYNPNFESMERLRRSFPWFQLDKKQFSQQKGQRWHGGVPIAYDPEERKLYLDTADTHTLVFGATGSLKTRAVVMPTIQVLGHAGESMIINDSKGELYNRMAGFLRDQGYNLVVINFRNPATGNAWNPLHIPYQFYMQGDLDRAAEFANDIANNLMAAEVSVKDPYWDYSACDLMFGLILLLFRYCRDHHYPDSAVNIGSLLELRQVLFNGRSAARESKLWKYASEDELTAARLRGTVHAPENTRNSILSVFDQKMCTFTIQPTLLDMLANHDFNLETVGTEKTAVFLITPDEKTSYHKLVSLFIKQSYEFLIYIASQTPENRVKNRITFVLDEFSSLPAIADMPSMISAARSRDLRFLLVVQSKSSLKRRYNEEAETILSNCTNWIFFTSRELELLRELSELCGQRKDRTPNISVYDLQHLNKERREALVLCGRMKPALVNLLDIDRFGQTQYTLLPLEKRERQPRMLLEFTLERKEAPKQAPPEEQPATPPADPVLLAQINSALAQLEALEKPADGDPAPAEDGE